MLALGAAAALLVLDATGRLSGHLANLWGILSAWTATLLFCCQPIAQLARNFTSPTTVSSLSLATVLLAMAGNCMMMPRAYFTRDLVWMVGSTWGSVMMGWGNLLCVVMAAASPTGCALLPGLAAGPVLIDWWHRFPDHTSQILNEFLTCHPSLRP